MPSVPSEALRILLALHFVGMALWLGGSLSLIFWSSSSKREGPAAVGYAYRVIDRVNRFLVMPGWLLVLITGLIMMPGRTTMAVNIMAGLGLLAVVLSAAMVLPTGARLAGAAEDCSRRGEFTEDFRRLDKRAALWASIVGVIVVVTVFVGVYAK